MDRDDRATSIKLTNVSKKYRIFDTPGDRLREALSPFRRTYHNDFWALKNVNIDIRQGQTVGLVGRNGSGKSTLLQVLAGVLQPTDGQVDVHGEIAALLELGTGFNPELTGRENVFLYNAIMKRSVTDMEAITAFIEEFADIGDFYDYPVKTYSSGMFARLAFTAAIATDPDILIIDEILAVGDARFLQKSYRHIQSMQDNGTTLLIVSHNAELILTLCDTVIYIDSGQVEFVGEPHSAIAHYHKKLFRDQGTSEIVSVDAPVIDVAPLAALAEAAALVPDAIKPLFAEGSALHVGMPSYNKDEDVISNVGAHIEDFVATADGIPNFVTLTGREEIDIYFRVRFDMDIFLPHIGLGLVTPEGVMISGMNTYLRGEGLPLAHRGDIKVYRARVKIDLNSGDYFLNFGINMDKGGVLSLVCVRRLAIHLHVMRDNSCTGFVNLPFEFESVTPLSK